MFPNVMHMITPKRSRKELKELAEHTVECWRSVPRPRYSKHNDEAIYDDRISDKDLTARARALVRHCLGKKVTEHA